MNKHQKIRFYDYGSPYYKVYDPEKKTSVYFAVKKYSGKAKALAAARIYLKSINSSGLTALLRASQTSNGLPRGLNAYATVNFRSLKTRVQESHILYFVVEASFETIPQFKLSVVKTPLSEVFSEVVKEYVRRMKLNDSEAKELLGLEDTARKSLIKQYRSACRTKGVKTKKDILANLKL